MRTHLKNNSEVAHVWAQQTQAEGEGSHFYFRGPTIFSYGPHFPIACFYEVKGQPLILFTSRDYSPSTAKHKCYTRGAIFGQRYIEVYFVEDVNTDLSRHQKNIEYGIEDITKLKDSLFRARVGIHDKMTALHIKIVDLLEYADAFAEQTGKLPAELRKTLKAYRKNTMQLTETEKSALLEKDRKNIEQERIRKEKANASRMEYLERWKNGENLQANFYGLPVALRIVGGELQTSLGVRVLLCEALELWQALKKGKDITGAKIGEHYTIDNVTDVQVIAGCHTIDRTEIDRVLVAYLK